MTGNPAAGNKTSLRLRVLLLTSMSVAVRGGCCHRQQTSMIEFPAYGKAAQTPTMPKRSLPETFDWSNVDGFNYLVPSWNQHIPTYCGSCYAHAALAAVQDRIKVSKGGRAPDITLSRQAFINCGPSYGFGAGCGGGKPPDIFNFMHVVGLPDETCNNYVAHNGDTCDEKAMCMNCMVLEDGSHECWPVERQVRYYVKEWGMLAGGEEAMMSEIFSRGPIVCGVVSDEDFDFGYDGGVHTRQAAGNESAINHDVEVTGWGVTPEGVKFWQARNSWGTYWGEGGFFKIERGINLNYFESECYFAITDSSEESLISKGSLTGGMHGLGEKNETAAAQGVAFRKSLDVLDWTTLDTPPVLARSLNTNDDEKAKPTNNAERLNARGSDVETAGTEGSSSMSVFLTGLAVGTIGGVLMSLVMVAWGKGLSRWGFPTARGGYDGISPGGVVDSVSESTALGRA